MTGSSDEQFAPDKLSPISRRMVEIKERVIAEWEKRTRASSADANALRHPILIDTLPAYYDNLILALSPNYSHRTALSSAALSSAAIASEHGGERARMTSYSPDELVLEYQILRETLFDFFAELGVRPSAEEIRIINSLIDDSIKEAINAFSLVVTALREQFIAALTHDMRGPLGSASMAAQIIRHTTDKPETVELADRIQDNIQRVDRMIQGLLDTMVFQQGSKLRLPLTHFDIHALATELCKEYAHANEMRCSVVGKSVWGWWGQDALKRALENLVGNALKYGYLNTPIQIRIAASHGRLRIAVHNDGPPIAIENQESIFQIFRRAQDAKEGAQQGWGIGLPYVRAVAESHGGSIAVYSSAEKGTTFVIDIPIDCRPFQNSPIVNS